MVLRYNIWKFSFFLWKLTYYFYVCYNKLKFSLLLGNNCGSHFVVAGKLFVLLGNEKSRITIGHHFHSLNGKNYNPLSRNICGAINVESNGKLFIGDYVGMSSVSIRCKSKIIIGNYVNIGADTIIMDNDAHSLDFRDRRRDNNRKDSENAKSAPIEIGNDVFIGTRCVIMKGVKIGDRAIIGTGSIVTKDIPDDCIAAGNPCKVIRKVEYNP